LKGASKGKGPKVHGSSDGGWGEKNPAERSGEKREASEGEVLAGRVSLSIRKVFHYLSHRKEFLNGRVTRKKYTVVNAIVPHFALHSFICGH